MGDRGNVIFKVKGAPDLYLYTHWSGSELPKIVRDSLERGRSRWDDETYLARILFSDMIKGYVEDLTGFGISTFMEDGGKEVYVNASDKTVAFRNKKWSFSDYVKAPDKDIDLFRADEDDEDA